MNGDDVQRKLNSMGYVEPTNYNTSNNPYSSYNESGDDPYTSSNFNPYSSINFEEVIKDICPTCNTKAMYICDCEFNDYTCKKNHCWYYKGEKLVIGDPHDQD